MNAYYPKIKDIINASLLLKKIMKPTLFEHHTDLSNKYLSNIYLKYESLTPVRSYKIRGAYNKMNSLKTKNGIKDPPTEIKETIIKILKFS